MNANASVHFIDRHLDEGRAEKVAFRAFGGGALSFGALAEGCARVAGAFARAGLCREERALMLVLDTLEFPQLFWGAIRAGVIPVPLNTLLSTSVYDEILRDSRAACLFVSAPLWDTIAPVVADNPFLRRIVVIGGPAPEGAETFDDFVAGAEPAAAIEVAGDEVAFWLYSSGSTGRPKGVRHIHSSLQATAETYGKGVLQIREDDVVYSVAKLFFAYGLGNAMTFPLAVGATTVLYAGRPTPEVVGDLLAREQPSIFCGVPTLFAAMLHHWGQGDAPANPRLRRSISAGEALPAEVGKRWHGIWGSDILDGVGSTEMLHIFLSNAPDDVVYGTSGTAVPGYDLRLVDETGAEVAAGDVGELLVCGDSAADGYWNQRDKTRATFEGVWTRTGDKYERTPEGRYIYCGRTDDMFKVSGIWVSPFEVEQALISHPAVLEAAVVSKRDSDGLEKPRAFVVLKDADSPDLAEALKAHVKTAIGQWKYPRWVDVVADLPKTATGKIQRFKLRDTP